MLSLQNQNKILTSYIQKVDRMKEQCVSIHCYRPAVLYPTVLYYNLRCWLKCKFLPERRHNRFVVIAYNEPFFCTIGKILMHLNIMKVIYSR